MPDKESKIKQLQVDIQKLKLELKQKEEELLQLQFEKCNKHAYSILSTMEVSRYSRQMLMPQIGVTGQIALKNAKVLIVGIGGLGCPAAQYLAAAGVGHLTLIDNDEVELTNLHRQILHKETNIGLSKSLSGADTLKSINSDIEVIPLQLHANSGTIESVIKNNKFDVVVDGTDNVATRYLINDVCVLHNIPLVSGSALRMEGQMTVYHYKNGPCYRCIFPQPPPPESVTSCGDGGVLGVVPGLIGIIQALEVIKIIIGLPVSSGSLLLFDGTESVFRKVKLRPRNKNCAICGDKPTINKLIDYEQFCNAKAHDKVENINILELDEVVSIEHFSNRFKENGTLTIDVRPETEFKMCKLPNTINIPYADIQKRNLNILENEINGKCIKSEVFVLCRRGNDSQRAVSLLKDFAKHLGVKFVNVEGGLYAYSKKIDRSFPVY